MSEDRLGAALRALVDFRAHNLDQLWRIDPERVSSLHVRPLSEGARDVSFAWSAQEIVIGFGVDGRIELGPPEEDLELAMKIASAVFDGQVFRLRRKRHDEIWVRVADEGWISTHHAYVRKPPPIELMTKYTPYQGRR